MLKRNTPKTSTLWYRAPENLQAIPEYDSKIDIWPIGCIIYEHIHQKVLFRGNNDGALVGPYISQFLYQPLSIPVGAFPPEVGVANLPLDVFKIDQVHPIAGAA